MADVDRAVGIRQSGSDDDFVPCHLFLSLLFFTFSTFSESTFSLFCHHMLLKNKRIFKDCHKLKKVSLQKYNLIILFYSTKSNSSSASSRVSGYWVRISSSVMIGTAGGTCSDGTSSGEGTSFGAQPRIKKATIASTMMKRNMTKLPLFRFIGYSPFLPVQANIGEPA